MIGPKRSKTSEGFLLCKDVALARVGEMIYGANELKRADGSQMFAGDAAGRVAIERNADVVFAPDTMNSFVGKDVTIKHPDALVTPETYQKDSHGTILNARRGQGSMSEFLVGDILIKSADGIAAVEHLREVSCGYDAEYEIISPGRGRQVKIVGNHLALVERGRCGPSCYVGDQDMSVNEEAEPMTIKTPFGAALMRRLFATTTDVEAQAILAEHERDEAVAAATATRDAEFETLKESMAKMQATLDALTPKVETEEEKAARIAAEAKATTTDAATLDAATATTLHPKIASAAEILSPGFAVPTFDATTTLDAVCACQRDALVKAYATAPGKAAIEVAMGGPADIAAMTADQVGAAFFSASHIMGLSNNAAMSAIIAAGGNGAGMVQSSIERSNAAEAASKKKWADRAAALATVRH